MQTGNWNFVRISQILSNVIGNSVTTKLTLKCKVFVFEVWRKKTTANVRFARIIPNNWNFDTSARKRR